MILASTRWQKRAAKYRADVERHDYMITSPPQLTRIARITWSTAKGINNVSYAVWCKPNKQAVNGIRSITRHQSNFRIVREWQVETYNHYSNQVWQRWERLIMAQAHRDGLDYHYARWLMVHGTKAGEYA